MLVYKDVVFDEKSCSHHSGELTYKNLEESYMDGCFGNQEPKLLVVHPASVHVLLHFLLDLDTAYYLESFPKFNAADISVSVVVPLNSVFFWGGKCNVVFTWS